MEKLKSDIKTIVIILLLITMLFGYCTMNSIKKAEIKKVHDSYESLLQDTITKVITKRDTFWQFKISTLSPKEIKETAVYKELEKSKRDLIKELEKNKNLLAIANLQLSANKRTAGDIKRYIILDKRFIISGKRWNIACIPGYNWWVSI
ncbi:MAG: hypothetical protein KatS3mg002_1387 [Candidatus Woesearchaeota archaeon]|nr:MAG: hypothetical protein KatS3mg002_1387 [Candidatus Woesearchaeota archaeon]